MNLGILIASLRVNFGEVLLEIHFADLPQGSTMSQSGIDFKVRLFTEKACHIWNIVSLFMALLGLNCRSRVGLSLAETTGAYSDHRVRVSCCRTWTRGLPGFRGCGMGRCLTHSGGVAHRLDCPCACGSFLGQGLNLHALHWEMDSLPLSHEGSYFSLGKSRRKQPKGLGRSGPCPSLTGYWEQFGDHPGVGDGAPLWRSLHTPHAQASLPAQAQIALSSQAFYNVEVSLFLRIGLGEAVILLLL